MRAPIGMKTTIGIDTPAAVAWKEALTGKLVLVGLTFVDDAGQLLDQFQTAGRVETGEEPGLWLRLADGGLFRIPADPDVVRPAGPGEYRLRHSGERVTDPDFLGHWEVAVRGRAEMERYRERGFPAAAE
jgi:hypothetical protein